VNGTARVQGNLFITGGGLQVSGSTSANRQVVELYTSGSVSRLAASYVGASSYGSLELLTSGLARLTIADTGAATFSSSVTATELYLSTSNGLVGNINSSNANGGYLTWQTSGTTIADLGTAQQIFGAGGNDTFGINGRGARAIAFGTNNTERMRITSGGNVGIGTDSPTAISGFTTLSVNNSTFGGIIETMYNNTPYGRLFTNANFYVGLLSVQNVPLIFGTNDTERIRITSGGNLLIGTTTDNGYKLQVNGTSYFNDTVNIGSTEPIPTFTAPNGGKILMLPNVVIVSGIIALGSPYTQNTQIDVVYNNWGGNNVIGLVDMIITLREFANVSGTAFGKVFATNSGSGSTFASFNTSNVTTSQCSVTASSGGNYTLRITIDPSNITDRGSFYLTIPNAGGTGSTINSITISYV
jgi:hypothetical protein